MTTKATVAGMTCTHCVRAVFTALTAVEGISRADVSIGAIEIEHDGRATEDALRAAVEVAGYRVITVTTDRRRLPLLTTDDTGSAERHG